MRHMITTEDYHPRVTRQDFGHLRRLSRCISDFQLCYLGCTPDIVRQASTVGGTLSTSPSPPQLFIDELPPEHLSDKQRRRRFIWHLHEQNYQKYLTSALCLHVDNITHNLEQSDLVSLAMDVTPTEPPSSLPPRSPSIMSFDETTDIAALQSVVADLTKRNKLLEAQVTEAISEIKASSNRAQTRYSEKLLANRNAERLQQALENERREREDDQIKAVRCYHSLKETIAGLIKEKDTFLKTKRKDSATDDESLTAQDGAVTHLQGQIQTQQDRITRLETALAASEATQNKQAQAIESSLPESPASNALAALDLEAHAIAVARLKSAEAKLIQERIVFNRAVEGTKTRFQNEAIEMKRKFEQARQQEEQKSVMLQQQLHAKTMEVSWCRQQLQKQQMGLQASQSRSQNNVGKYAASQLAPEQKSTLDEHAKKRQRVDSVGATGTQIPQFNRAVSRQTHPANSIVTPQSQSSSDDGYRPSPTTPAHLPSSSSTSSQDRHERPMTQQMAKPMGMSDFHRRKLSQNSNSTNTLSLSSPRSTSQRTLKQSTSQVPNQGPHPSHISLAGSINRPQQMDQSQQMYQQQQAGHAPRPFYQQPRLQQQQQVNPQQQMSRQKRSTDGPQASGTILNTQQQPSFDFQVGPHVANQARAAKGIQDTRELSYRQIQAVMHIPNPKLQTLDRSDMTGSQQVQQHDFKASGKDAMLLQPSMNVPTTPGKAAQLFLPQNRPQSTLANAQFQSPASQWAAQQRFERIMKAARQKMGFAPGLDSVQTPTSSNLTDDSGSEHHNNITQVTHCPSGFEPSREPKSLRNVAVPMSPAAGQGIRLQSGGSGNLTANFDHSFPSWSTELGPTMFVGDSLQFDGWTSDRVLAPVTNTTTVASTAPRSDTGTTDVEYTSQPGEPLQHTTRDPSLSILGAQFQRPKNTCRAPTPNVSAHIPCVYCYSHWWEHSCEGQPCTNCQKKGVDCLRPKCADFADCAKGYRCKLVHENDPRYYDMNYLITLPKAGAMPKRIGTKAKAKEAPSVLGKRKADAITEA
ncbi:hypothetical protein IAQ61_007806 [Plenodomus lingam]|uniref:uncharacterized protein n=1 Tax=Leptosphaeria maculans TaxID=5022 RepID=UPI00331D4F25|nr:hypothetical protein IAQ61_007806 [Plenodomus lingam]